jgi:polar amino acid transport system substrate-binding protein
MMRERANRGARTVVLVATLAALNACGSTTDRAAAIDAVAALDVAPVDSAPDADSSLGAPTPETIAEQRRVECELYGPTASLRPTGAAKANAITPGSFMAEIRDRGHLVVGVDENTLGFAHHDPETGQIVGFEVDIANEIADRIFDGAARPAQVWLLPVVTEEKVPFARDGRVDMTISATSMTCGRWSDVAFSTEYYTAHQEFLVRKDSTLRDAADLAGRTVCVTAGSSSIGILEDLAPEADLLEVNARTECLVALQQGDADAYFGHDSFIYGMLGQDRTVEVRSGILDPEDTVSHYGIAIAHEHEDFVRFVNTVLEELRADGTWEELHAARLQPPPPVGIHLPPASPPEPEYRD